MDFFLNFGEIFSFNPPFYRNTKMTNSPMYAGRTRRIIPITLSLAVFLSVAILVCGFIVASSMEYSPNANSGIEGSDFTTVVRVY